ncbi:MAG TPA: hypothetical protein VH008_17895 [Pseudonocardia sp.]|jgi:acyl-CoA reductase-like NAD-dependent aldehyde dehydrogenase|nr:hypothetical protein [Pseudonocardia sp.]
MAGARGPAEQQPTLTRSLTVGSSLDPAIRIGLLVSRRQRVRVEGTTRMRSGWRTNRRTGSAGAGVSVKASGVGLKFGPDALLNYRRIQSVYP